MIERAEEKGIPFPYLYDETQNTAHAYGPERTPHMFVFGPQRTLVYKGAIDNYHEAPSFLSDAPDAVLAGEEVEIAETREGIGGVQGVWLHRQVSDRRGTEEDGLEVTDLSTGGATWLADSIDGIL